MGLISPTLASPKGALPGPCPYCASPKGALPNGPHLLADTGVDPKVPRPGPTYCASPKGASPNGPYLSDTGVAERSSPWSYILCLTQRCLAQWASSHRHWGGQRCLDLVLHFCASPRGALPNGPYLTDTGVAQGASPGPTYCASPGEVPGPMGLISPTLALGRGGALDLVLHTVPHPEVPCPMGLISPTLASPEGARPGLTYCASPKGALMGLSQHWRRPKVPRLVTYCASPKGACQWPHLTELACPRCRPGPTSCLTQVCPMGLISPTLASPRCSAPGLHTVPHPRVPCPTRGLISPTLASPKGAQPGPTYCASPRGASPNGPYRSEMGRRPKVPCPGLLHTGPHPKGAWPNGPHRTDTGVAQRCLDLGPTYCASPRGALPNGPHSTDTGLRPKVPRPVLHTVPHPRVPRPLGLISPTLALPKGASPWSDILCLTPEVPRPMGLISPTPASPKGVLGPAHLLDPSALAQWASSHRHWRRPRVPRPGPTYGASPRGASPNGPYLTDTGVAQRCSRPWSYTLLHPVPRPMGLISPTLALPEGASTWSYI